MTRLVLYKLFFVKSNSSLLLRTILQALFASFIGSFGFSVVAAADIIADRKAGFKAINASAKAITAAIGGGDYAIVIREANNISSWAQKIPSYFPEGSGSGDTRARAEIWVNFDDFTALSKANETAANRLVTAAKSGDPDVMMASLEKLGESCRACHKSYVEQR